MGLTVVLAWAAAACSGGGGGAPALGGLTESGYLAQVSTGDASVHLTTGQGPLGFANLNALARDPASGVVYGLATPSSSGAMALLRIDTNAGARGLASAPLVVGEVSQGASNLAWRSSDGMLYGVSVGGLLFPGKLIRIDPATGASEEVGECAKATSIAYDPLTDALYGVVGSSFQRIQPDSGASTQLFTETALLPKVRALALDPLTGLFHGVFHDMSSAPGVVTIDLFGNVDEVATIDETLVDLEIDPQSGAMLGLGDGGSIAGVTPGASEYAVEHRGNVGCQLFDFTPDPADGGYFGVDTSEHLVKFWLDGAMRTIGRLAVPTRQLVYDAGVQELWGIGSELIYTSSDLYIYPVDTATAATGTPVLTQLEGGSEVVYETVQHLLRSNVDGGNPGDWFTTLDPLTGSIVAQNLAPSPALLGLAWEPEGSKLVCAFSDGSPDQTRIALANLSGPSVIELLGSVPFDLSVLEQHPAAATYLGQGPAGDLFEVTLGTKVTHRTIDSVKAATYHSATWVPPLGRVYATTSDEVWSIDPASGASTRVGGTPNDELPSGLAWDPEREQLGFLIDDEVRWTSKSAPWHAPQTTSLGGIDVRHLAFSPERGVFYLLGDGGLFTLARNESSAAIGAVSAISPPANVRDMAWHGGALWASSSDGHLWRVDPDSGAWTDVGAMGFAMQGLY